MAEIIAVTNQKGGVGKSTVVCNLAAGLVRKKRKVLCVELDAQENLAFCMGLPARYFSLTAYDVLKGNTTAAAAVVHAQIADVIRAGAELATAELFLNKDYTLREQLEPIRKSYDYILIDTPPTLGILTINALTAADSVIIPAAADAFSLQAIGQLSRTIKAVKTVSNPTLKIKGIVISRYNSKTVFSRDMTENFRATAEQLNAKVFNTYLREYSAVREAQLMQKDIYAYAPNSNAAADFDAFTGEIIAEEK